MIVRKKAHSPRGVVWRLVAALSVTGPAALLGGCSAFTDPAYPPVHDLPAPRADAPMTQDEIKRATSDLVTERNTLNAEAKATPDSGATGSTPAASPGAKPAPAAKTQTSGARPNP